MLNRRKAFSLLGGAAGAAVAAPVVAQALPASPKALSVALDVTGAGMTASEIMDLGDKLAREIAAAQAHAMGRMAGARNAGDLSPADWDQIVASGCQPPPWYGKAPK
jgi:hypothetical protein